MAIVLLIGFILTVCYFYYRFALLAYITYLVLKMITRKRAQLVKIMAFRLCLSIMHIKRQMLHNLKPCCIAI